MNDVQQMEQRHETPQSVFDELCERRRVLSKDIKLRSDALDNIPRYKELSKELTTARVARKSIAADFDSKESIADRIKSKREDVEALEAKLVGLSLEHFKSTGSTLELGKKMRDGSVKKVRITFSYQLSLF